MLRVSAVIVLGCLLALPADADMLTRETGERPGITIDAPLTRLNIRGHGENRVVVEGDVQVAVDLERTAEGVRIRVGSPAPVQLNVWVPPVAMLAVTGRLADITVEDIDGDVEAHNHHNPVTVRNVRGDVVASSFLAPVTVQGVSGAVRAESNQADVRLSAIGGDAWARTANASVSLEDSHSQRVELQALGGVVRYVGRVSQRGDVLLASHNGVIEVRLDASSDVLVELRGKADLFQVSGASLQRENARQAHTMVGGGQGRMRLESPRGPINLRVATFD